MAKQRLEKFASVRNWLRSVGTNSPKGKLTKKAREARLETMADFLEFLSGGPDNGMSPDDMLGEARANLDATKDRLMDYFGWSKGDFIKGHAKREVAISYNSAITRLAIMRGFFSHNGVGFGKWRLPKRQVSKVSTADDQTPIYDYDEEAERSVFKNETLQHFFGNLNFRDQSIALGMLSTGADAADLLKLNVGFVRGQKNERRLFWHGNREKDAEPFKTFFSEEATRFMRQFVEQVRAKAKAKDPLFINNWGRRLNVHALDMTFRAAAKRMGYDNDEGNPFRPKRFRHLFRTACTMAGIDPGFINAFMGHKTDVSGTYLEKPRGLLVKEYVKVEGFITVFGKTGEETKRLSEKTSVLEGMIDERGRQLKDLEVELRNVRTELRDAKMTREELRGEVREVRGELDSVRTITEAVVGMVMVEPLEASAKKRVDNFVGVISRMVREREAELGRKIEAAELTRIMADAFKKSPTLNLIRDLAAEGKKSGRVRGS